MYQPIIDIIGLPAWERLSSTFRKNVGHNRNQMHVAAAILREYVKKLSPEYPSWLYRSIDRDCLKRLQLLTSPAYSGGPTPTLTDFMVMMSEFVNLGIVSTRLTNVAPKKQEQAGYFQQGRVWELVPSAPVAAQELEQEEPPPLETFFTAESVLAALLIN